MAIQIEFIQEKFFRFAKDKVTKETKGLYPAPYKVLDVVRKGIEKGPRAGYDAEAVAFGELAMSHQSKGLVSLFHGRTECKKNRVGSPKRPVRYEIHMNFQPFSHVSLSFVNLKAFFELF